MQTELHWNYTDKYRDLTALQNPRCYARSLDTCSRLISLEHPVSEGIFGGAKSVEVHGGRFVEPRRIGLGSAGANILCTVHNSQLSAFDDEAIKIANHCTTFWDNQLSTRVFIDGSRIERWMLKLICGISADGSAHGTKAEPSPPEVRQLFGLEPLPDRFAVYGLKNIRVTREWNRVCSHRFFMNHQTGGVDLGVIVICGLPLMAYVGEGDPSEAIRGPEFVGEIDVRGAVAVRRPSNMILQEDARNELTLSFFY